MSAENVRRLSIRWSEKPDQIFARSTVFVALDILHRIGRYLATHNGEVKKLKPPQTGFRLRCGYYRLFFEEQSAISIEIIGVRHRREAYR